MPSKRPVASVAKNSLIEVKIEKQMESKYSLFLPVAPKHNIHKLVMERLRLEM